jgi:hypothetical protein
MYAILPLNYLGGIWPEGYMGGDIDLAKGGTGYSGLFLVDNFTWNGFVKYVDYISKSLATYDNVIFLLFSEGAEPVPYYYSSVDSRLSKVPQEIIKDLQNWTWFNTPTNADYVSYWNGRWKPSPEFTTPSDVKPIIYCGILKGVPTSTPGYNYCVDYRKWTSSLLRKRFSSLPDLIRRNHPTAVVGYHDWLLIEEAALIGLTRDDLPIDPNNNPFDFLSFNKYPETEDEYNNFAALIDDIIRNFQIYYGKGPELLGETGMCSRGKWSGSEDEVNNKIATFYDNLIPYLKNKKLGFNFWDWLDRWFSLSSDWVNACQSSYGLIDLQGNPKPQYNVISRHLKGCVSLFLKNGSVKPVIVEKGADYTITCDYGQRVDSIFPLTKSGNCVWSGWQGTSTATFKCKAGLKWGTFPVYCRVKSGTYSNTCDRKDLIDYIKVTLPRAPKCKPRPPCLDQIPPCLIPEPAEGWCPKPVSYIKVLSPNGGEVWKKGTVQLIKWQDNRQFIQPTTKYYDLRLVPKSPECTGRFCPLYLPAPYVIDKRVPRKPGTEIVYKWGVGKVKDNREVPDGEYKVEVCESGTNNCDMSDNYFKIVSAPSEVILDVKVLDPKTNQYTDGPVTIEVGKEAKVKWETNMPPRYNKAECRKYGPWSGNVEPNGEDTFLVKEEKTYTLGIECTLSYECQGDFCPLTMAPVLPSIVVKDEVIVKGVKNVTGSIKILSPNEGTIQLIKWQDNRQFFVSTTKYNYLLVNDLHRSSRKSRY